MVVNEINISRREGGIMCVLTEDALKFSSLQMPDIDNTWIKTIKISPTTLELIDFSSYSTRRHDGIVVAFPFSTFVGFIELLLNICFSTYAIYLTAIRNGNKFLTDSELQTHAQIATDVNNYTKLSINKVSTCMSVWHHRISKTLTNGGSRPSSPLQHIWVSFLDYAFDHHWNRELLKV